MQWLALLLCLLWLKRKFNRQPSSSRFLLKGKFELYYQRRSSVIWAHFHFSREICEEKNVESGIMFVFSLLLNVEFLQPQSGFLDSSPVFGVLLSNKCFLNLQQLLCFPAQERKVDPLHFLVTQLQSQIPQEVLGPGPAVSRDTELFHTWMVSCHVWFSAHLPAVSVCVGVFYNPVSPVWIALIWFVSFIIHVFIFPPTDLLCEKPFVMSDPNT